MPSRRSVHRQPTRETMPQKIAITLKLECEVPDGFDPHDIDINYRPQMYKRDTEEEISGIEWNSFTDLEIKPIEKFTLGEDKEAEEYLWVHLLSARGVLVDGKMVMEIAWKAGLPARVPNHATITLTGMVHGTELEGKLVIQQPPKKAE